MPKKLMDNRDKLQAMLQLEKAQEEYRKAVVEHIKTSIECVPVQFNAVNSMSFSVRFSQLNSQMILSPEYYNQRTQARLVADKLSRITSTQDFINQIHQMIEKETVVVNKTTHRLNDKTIEVLRRYV